MQRSEPNGNGVNEQREGLDSTPCSRTTCDIARALLVFSEADDYLGSTVSAGRDISTHRRMIAEARLNYMTLLPSWALGHLITLQLHTSPSLYLA